MPNMHSETTQWLPKGLFHPGSEAEWRDFILKELKGVPFEKVLSKSLEGEQIFPFYTQSSETEIPYLEISEWFDFIREVNPPYLRILQPLISDGTETLESDYTCDEICTVLNEERTIDEISSQVHPWIDIRFAYSEKVRQSLTLKGFKGFADWSNQATPFSTDWPHGFRPYCFSARAYHHAGSNAVQDIAFVLQDFLSWADQWTDQGFKIEDALPFVHFRFSLGPDLFSGMALIRAFRGLYFQLLKKYGVGHPESPVILADASLRFYTSLDPHNNLLRAGAAAVAAMATGCAAFEAWPFSGKAPRAFAYRMNRNMIRLMREESYISYTADPLGGAWALESLTWSRMQVAEKHLRISEENLSQLSAFRESQLSDSQKVISDLSATGRLNMIGVNLQADLHQEIAGFYHFEGMPENIFRIAQPFEAIQLQGRTLPGYRFHFTCSEKECQARADFIRQFMSVCGLKETDHAQALWVLCGKDEDYKDAATLNLLNESKGSRHWLLAGNPQEGQAVLKAHGIKTFIHLQSNRVKTAQILHQLLSE
jgi:methylmalonyl-CoA mutase